MINTLSKRLPLSELLRDSDSVKAMNAQTEITLSGGFVGHEDVWSESSSESRKECVGLLGNQDEQLISRCLPHSGGRSA